MANTVGIVLLQHVGGLLGAIFPEQRSRAFRSNSDMVLAMKICNGLSLCLQGQDVGDWHKYAELYSAISSNMTLVLSFEACCGGLDQ